MLQRFHIDIRLDPMVEIQYLIKVIEKRDEKESYDKVGMPLG